MWGTLINGIQASALEHHDWMQASWNGATSKSGIGHYVVVHSDALCIVGFLAAYTAGKHSVH